MRKRKVAILFFVGLLMLSGCSVSKNAFEDKIISTMILEDTIAYEGDYLGISNSGDMMIFLESDQLIIRDTKTWEIISSKEVDIDIRNDIYLRPHGTFSEDEKYILFTVRFGQVSDVFKYYKQEGILVYDIEAQAFIDVIELKDGEMVVAPMWGPDNTISYVSYGEQTCITYITSIDGNPEKVYEMDLEDGLIMWTKMLNKDQMILCISTMSIEEDEYLLLYDIKKDKDEVIFTDEDGYITYSGVSNDALTVLIKTSAYTDEGLDLNYYTINFDGRYKEYDVNACDFDLMMINACLTQGGSYVIGKAMDFDKGDFNYYLYHTQQNEIAELMLVGSEQLSNEAEGAQIIFHNALTLYETQNHKLYAYSGDKEILIYNLLD